MIDFNSLNKFLEKQIDDISENIIPIASEKEMLNANFAMPHTYKVVITPTSHNNYGSSVSLTRIFINDDTDYLKVKTVKTDSTYSATVDMTENSTQKSTYPMTISSGNTATEGNYKVYNSLTDAGWVWLASGVGTITYSFDCMNISNFRFQPNWNGHGGGYYYRRCCRGCTVKVYCDDKLIFDKSFSSLDYLARINLKFSDYETCTSFIDNGPGGW